MTTFSLAPLGRHGRHETWRTTSKHGHRSRKSEHLKRKVRGIVSLIALFVSEILPTNQFSRKRFWNLKRHQKSNCHYSSEWVGEPDYPFGYAFLFGLWIFWILIISWITLQTRAGYLLKLLIRWLRSWQESDQPSRPRKVINHRDLENWSIMRNKKSDPLSITRKVINQQYLETWSTITR